MQGAIDAWEQGAMIFCVHVDADAANDKNVFKHKISPLFNRMQEYAGDVICKTVIPVIPVRMSEAWMLADIALLKDEIGTDLSNSTLGLHRSPENIADPKKTIEEAIRIARQNIVRKRRHELKISELYQPIGQKIELDKLENLPSYLKFKEAARYAYRKLNYL